MISFTRNKMIFLSLILGVFGLLLFIVDFESMSEETDAIQISGSKSRKLTPNRPKGSDYQNPSSGKVVERGQVSRGDGDERKGALLVPRLSAGLGDDLIRDIRENMVPLVDDPVWEDGQNIAAEMTPREVRSAFTDINGIGATALFTPTSFVSDGDMTFFWNGFHDEPVMGYGINRKTKIRFKWRLDELGFPEFMAHRGSDNLMVVLSDSQMQEFREQSSRRLADMLRAMREKEEESE